MGLKLAEIGELLEIQDRGACPCGHTRTLVERRISEINAEMTRHSELRKELASMSDLECPATTDGDLWPASIATAGLSARVTPAAASRLGGSRC